MNNILFHSTLIELFRNINGKVNGLMNQFYQPYGMTGVQAFVLFRLVETGGEKISSLSKELGMTNSNISAICQRLEKRDLIERIRDKKDQRVVKAVPTAHAKDLMNTLIHSSQFEVLPLFASDISDEEKKTILTGLQTLDDILTSLTHPSHPTQIFLDQE